MDNIPTVPFPINIVRDARGPLKVGIDDYRMQDNMAAAIYGLLIGQPVVVYFSDPEWSLPLSKYEAAMYLLKPEHIPYLRERILPINIDDKSFYWLLFMLCAEPGRFNFGPIFNPERFIGKHEINIYTELTGVQAPVGDYKITPLIYSNSSEAFQGGYHMYYFLFYSRRVLIPKQYIEILDDIQAFNNPLKAQVDNYFSQEYMYTSLSVAHNDLAILAIEYFQNYDPTGEGSLKVHTKELVQEFGLERPQHKTRRQLLQVYNYINSIGSYPSIVPRISLLVDGKRYINYSNEQEEVIPMNDIETYEESIFGYLASSLCSKLHTENHIEGALNKLGASHSRYMYSIGYLDELLILVELEEDMDDFLVGIACYHLLYQCLTMRTSKYVDLQDKDMRSKTGVRKLKHKLEIACIDYPMLKDLPFYRELAIIQEVLPLRRDIKEVLGIKLLDIDNTISMVCSTLEVTDVQYARIINGVIEELGLREEFGLIKTSFRRNENITPNSIEKTYKIMQILADYQGRNALVLPDLTYGNYSELNSQLSFPDIPGENEEEY